MELIYQFQETGVGCRRHKNPECLCDVKPLPQGVPIVRVPRLAPVPDGLDSPALEFIVWASTTLGRFEALLGVNEAALNDALALWEGRGDYTTGSHLAAQQVKAANQCLRAGLTLEQTARWLITETVAIMDLFYPREKHQLILEIEKHIRAGCSAKQVAEATGANQNYVTDVARRWGVKMPHSGARYGPEVKRKARHLVRKGMSRRAAARQLGLSETRVASWCKDLPGQRPGRPKGSK